MDTRPLLLALLCAAAGWSAEPGTDLLGDGGGGKATATAAQVARPDDDARREAVARIKKTYAADYARRSPRDKQRLARKLLKAAPLAVDAPTRDGLISESLRIAIEGEDPEGVLAAIEALATSFSGVDVVAEKRTAFRRIFRKPVGAAIVKLLDTPDDPRANAVVGKWYAFEARRWSEALPMLAASGDPGLVAVAKMEGAKPANVGERLQIADAWRELGRKASGEDRIGMYARAVTWYQQALPELSGENAARAKQAVAQMLPLIPLDIDTVDWATLTAADWERIQAPVVTVQARVDRTDTQVALGDHEFLRVVPNPGETWTFGVYDLTAKVVCTWKGQKTSVVMQNNSGGRNRVAGAGGGGGGGGGGAGGGGYGGTIGLRNVTLGVDGQPYGALLMWLSPNEKALAGVIAGPGKVWLGPSSDRTDESEATGAIRVKLVPVDEPEPAAPVTPAPAKTGPIPGK